MGTVFGIVAALIALVGLLTALGHVGYLAMLNNAATKRGLSGGSTTDFVNTRWKVAGGTLGVAVVALLLTGADSVPADVLGMLLGGGAAVVSKQALDSTRRQFRNHP